MGGRARGVGRSGLAHRQLILFQPARQGKIAVDPEAFGAYYRKLNKMPGSSRLAPLPNVAPEPEETPAEETVQPQTLGGGAGTASSSAAQ